MTKVYCVFEGGGVKGSALVGALARAQQESALEFCGFAGSSAGAIVAALAAVGYPAWTPNNQFKSNATADMKSIMDKLNYMDFLDNHNELPLEEIRHNLASLNKFSSDADKIIQEIETLMGRSWPGKIFGLMKFTKKHQPILKNLMGMKKCFDKLLVAKGFYGTNSFEKWLKQVLQEKGEIDKNGKVTFGIIEKRRNIILKVVATELRNRRPRIYDPSEYAGTEVSSAVQASMSIPIFFRPYAEGNSFLVDGGMLSNFPAWAFDLEKSNKETNLHVIGFRLVPEEIADRPIDTFQHYASELFHTALDGTDELQTRQVTKLLLINIVTPPRIWATKFDLSSEERRQLFTAGYQAADEKFSEKSTRKFLSLPPIV